jgi:hypothetical protein
MEETKKVVYFKRNVPYTVGGRFNTADTQGFVLNRLQPWIGVPLDNLRDFKMVNRRALIEGLIVETNEPSVDWATPNALTDEAVDELLKSYLKLKSTLAEVTSVSILSKMLERAKEQNKSGKTVSLIQSRLDEISDPDVISPKDMGGVS